MRAPTIPVFLAAAAIVAAGSGVCSDERIPVDLALRVAYGAEPGPESLLDDVAHVLLAELRAKGCFRGVAPAAPGRAPEADVLLEVMLSEVREETRFEQSLAERAQAADATATAVGVVATFALRVDYRLAAVPGGTVVRDGGFRVSGERRPRYAGDDARAGARGEALLDLARRTRAKLNHGSPAKLARAIEEARRAP